MASFEQGDVIKVPFPYTDRPTRQSRPALVVSTRSLDDGHGLLWVLMITSAANRGWQGDVSLERRFAECGLKVPCVVRSAKITTVEASRAQKSGTLPADIWSDVRGEMERRLF